MNIIPLVAIGAGVFLAIRAPEAGQDSDAPRGIRNNNPGNLVNNGIDWNGLSATQTDTRFYQFADPVYGIRALARVLNVYRNREGLDGLGGPGIDTIREVIYRWAPPHENDTEAYIRAVANEMQTPDRVALQMRDYPALVKAIIRHENGIQPYPDSIISEGIERAAA